MAKPLNDKLVIAFGFLGYGRPGSVPDPKKDLLQLDALRVVNEAGWGERADIATRSEELVRLARPDLRNSIADHSLDKLDRPDIQQQVPEAQIRVFVNEKTREVVIVGQGSVFPNIPGSSKLSNWGSDLTNSGYSEYRKFEP